MIKAVIFDLDGTVIDSEEKYIVAWQKAVQRHNFNLTHQDLLGICGISAQRRNRLLIQTLESPWMMFIWPLNQAKKSSYPWLNLAK
jgi:beta-phosphoglucomutase-like phosphatase (HAD superfamily)